MVCKYFLVHALHVSQYSHKFHTKLTLYGTNNMHNASCCAVSMDIKQNSFVCSQLRDVLNTGMF